MALAEQFWRHVLTGPGCWEWTGARRRDGYGEMRRARRGTGSIVRVHRVAWTLAHGPIPEGLDVLHHCDNRACVKTEPDERYPDGHLWLGTDLDNHRDGMVKGRSATGDRHGTHTHPGLWRGERHGRARLTEDDVRRIRTDRSGVTQTGLAASFGVSRRTIRSIIDRTRWGWLP